MQPPSPQLLRALRRATRSATSYRPLGFTPISSNLQCTSQCRAVPSSRCVSTSLPQRSSASTDVSVPHARASSNAPASTDRGPSSSETTQTDFSALNVLGGMAPPSTAIETCMDDGFLLDNGVQVSGSGILLVQGEAFHWRPWRASSSGQTAAALSSAPAARPTMLNAKGQWELDNVALGLLECVWPKPELLILGQGASIYPLAPATKSRINNLGIRLDVQDSRNAAAQFNLLATERGVGTVAAALLPVGWRER